MSSAAAAATQPRGMLDPRGVVVVSESQRCAPRTGNTTTVCSDQQPSELTTGKHENREVVARTGAATLQ